MNVVGLVPLAAMSLNNTTPYNTIHISRAVAALAIMAHYPVIT